MGSLRVSRMHGDDVDGAIDDISAPHGASQPTDRLYPIVQFTIAAGAIVLADAGLMRVALENLIRNAWKYTEETAAASIEFGYERTAHEIVCFVRDNGAGFNPEFADRLFKPFQRLHSQGEFVGTGIGLATVQRIIFRHGGRVWAEGKVGEGATFHFALDL